MTGMGMTERQLLKKRCSGSTIGKMIARFSELFAKAG
jgi:hypothetical protein